MTLPSQLSSLELSKKLRELKVKQESLFFWIAPEDSEKWPAKLVYKTGLGVYYENGAGVNEKTFKLAPVFVSAFTSAELGEMLPAKINGFHIRYEKTATEYGFFRWSVTYWEIGREDEQRFEGRYSDIGEADARAKMLIYLLEHNLLTIEK